MIRAALAILLVASSAMAQPAAPSDPNDRAKTLYTDGKRHYDVADYDHAIDVWKQAYVISNAPMLLFNLGQAYRLKGDCTSALRFYANYEREAGANVDNQTELDEAKARCNPQPTNANPPPTFPPATQPPTDQSLHNVELDRPAPPPARVVDDDSQSSWKPRGLATGIGGAVLVGVGLYLGSRARSDANQVASYRGEWTATQQDLQSSGQSVATWSELVTGVGIAAIAGGVVMYLVGARAPPHAQIAVTSHTAGFAWSASF